MQQWLNYRMRITIQDSRVMIGQFMAFDKHMNIILGDTEEYRKVGGKRTEQREQKRSLGLCLIRGECIVSLSVEAPPAPTVCFLFCLAPSTILPVSATFHYLVPMQPTPTAKDGNETRIQHAAQQQQQTQLQTNKQEAANNNNNKQQQQQQQPANNNTNSKQQQQQAQLQQTNNKQQQ